MAKVKPPGGRSSYVDPDELDGYRDSASLAEEVNAAVDAVLADPTDPERRAVKRRSQERYRALRREKRDDDIAAGRRAAGNNVGVVSHLDANGDPDTDSDDGAAYWAEVARAVEEGVPNAVGSQR